MNGDISITSNSQHYRNDKISPVSSPVSDSDINSIDLTLDSTENSDDNLKDAVPAVDGSVPFKLYSTKDGSHLEYMDLKEDVTTFSFVFETKLCWSQIQSVGVRKSKEFH